MQVQTIVFVMQAVSKSRSAATAAEHKVNLGRMPLNKQLQTPNQSAA